MRILWFLILIGLSEASLAFRCGNQLVSEGDTRYEVEAICGEPEDSSTHTYYRSIANQEVVDCEPVRTHTVESLAKEPEEEPEPRSCLALVEDRLAIRVDVDIWLYDRGRNRFMKQVYFENGRVTRIETLGYGKKARR